MIHLIIYKIYKIIVSKKMLAYDFFLSVYIVQRVGGRETLRAELLLVHIITGTIFTRKQENKKVYWIITIILTLMYLPSLIIGFIQDVMPFLGI